jgi:hypothetical protein
MSAILSDNFRFYNLDNFINTLSSNSIYMFIGRSAAWDNESNPPVPLDNPAYRRDVYDQMIALKKLSSSNVIPVVKKITWASGITYDMYRPDYTTGNTEGSSTRYPAKLSSNGYSTLNYGAQFYVMNEFYQVYKCLYNGQSPTNPNGVPSTVEPTGISTSPIVTSDGYRWKYLYTIPTFYVLNFINDYYIPVPYAGSSFPQESAVTNSAAPGAIDTTVVTNAGTGYNNGTYVNVPISGDGSGGLITIVVANGQISSATVTNPGSGYTFASINIAAAGLGAGSNGSIEVVVPPKYGHGHNPYNELGAYRLMIHTTIPYNESQFPTDTSYRRIGLISNPYIKGSTTVATAADISQLNSVTFSSVSGNFQVGEIINQSSTNASGRVVSWDSTNKILKYYQDRFDGVYQQNLVQFSDTNTITGFSSSVTGTPSSYTQPGIEKSTGRILYIDNRVAVNRAASQIEDVKIVVEF